jgi:hypothetical protein
MRFINLSDITKLEVFLFSLSSNILFFLSFPKHIMSSCHAISQGREDSSMQLQFFRQLGTPMVRLWLYRNIGR